MAYPCRFFVCIIKPTSQQERVFMSRITITLSSQEKNALRILSEKQFREPRAQATLIIRRELELQGLIAPANAQPVITPPAQEPSAQGEADQPIPNESEK